VRNWKRSWEFSKLSTVAVLVKMVPLAFRKEAHRQARLAFAAMFIWKFMVWMP
jgi:hypothetical protein